MIENGEYVKAENVKTQVKASTISKTNENKLSASDIDALRESLLRGSYDVSTLNGVDYVSDFYPYAHENRSNPPMLTRRVSGPAVMMNSMSGMGYHGMEHISPHFASHHMTSNMHTGGSMPMLVRHHSASVVQPHMSYPMLHNHLYKNTMKNSIPLPPNEAYFHGYMESSKRELGSASDETKRESFSNFLNDTDNNRNVEPIQFTSIVEDETRPSYAANQELRQLALSVFAPASATIQEAPSDRSVDQFSIASEDTRIMNTPRPCVGMSLDYQNPVVMSPSEKCLSHIPPQGYSGPTVLQQNYMSGHIPTHTQLTPVTSYGSGSMNTEFNSMLVSTPRTPKCQSNCKFVGCMRRVRSKGFCKAHGGGRECAIEGCSKSSQHGEFCIGHGGGKKCREEGCAKAAQSHGLCKAHGGGARCKFPDCSKSSQGGGLCRAHGGGKRCQAAGCSKGAQRGDFCATHGGFRNCKVDGCVRTDRGGGYCEVHRRGRLCKVMGCKKLSRNHGMCTMHIREEKQFSNDEEKQDEPIGSNSSWSIPRTVIA